MTPTTNSQAKALPSKSQGVTELKTVSKGHVGGSQPKKTQVDHGTDTPAVDCEDAEIREPPASQGERPQQTVMLISP